MTEYYYLAKNCGSGTLSLKFMRCQNPYQLQNLKIFVDISGVQNPIWAKFLEFDFFYLKRQVYVDITRTKINLGSHHLQTNLIMKLLIKSDILA